MNRLEEQFDHRRRTGRKSLLPFVTAGYPDLATTLEILRRIDPGPCACVEVGIPFSDPIADGPVIQTSFSRALERGFRVDGLLELLAQRRAEIAVPLVAMVSYSIVQRRGPAAFIAAAVAAGFDGLIVPDLSIEEADELAAAGRAHDCPLVMMIAPTSDEGRRRRIAAISEPFIYYQSLAGTTGERERMPADLAENVRRLKQESGKPVCVGFGISKPAHVAAVCEMADGAIVGSAIVRQMNEAVDRGQPAEEIAAGVAAKVNELAAGLPRLD